MDWHNLQQFNEPNDEVNCRNAAMHLPHCPVTKELERNGNLCAS
jgi:hypothetical protein